jgi:Fe-S-cluster containining protein
MRPDGSIDHEALRRAAGELVSQSDVDVQRAQQDVLTRKAPGLLVLSPKDLAHRDVPGQHPDCASCSDNCCHAPHLANLGLVDIARLRDAGLSWAIADAAEGTLPTLKQPGGRCAFLDEHARCAIYPIRPHVCRAFPYQVDDAATEVRYSRACPSVSADRDEAAAAHMIDDAVTRYRQRAADKLLLQRPPEAVRRVLNPSTRSFADVLGAKLED